MSDLAEIVTGSSMDAKDAQQSAPVLALSGTTPIAVAPTGGYNFLQSAKDWYGTAKTNVSSSAAKVASTANTNSGLMWLILAVMVAAGLFLFSAKGKGKGKGSFFKSVAGRKPSGGSLPR